MRNVKYHLLILTNHDSHKNYIGASIYPKSKCSLLNNIFTRFSELYASSYISNICLSIRLYHILGILLLVIILFSP